MMRAITIRQPYGWAVIHGGKPVENRSRNIVGQYRGLVAIHAAKQADYATGDSCVPLVESTHAWLKSHGYHPAPDRADNDIQCGYWRDDNDRPFPPNDWSFPPDARPWFHNLGAVIGVAEIVNVHWSGMEGGIIVTPDDHVIDCSKGCNEYNLCSPWAVPYQYHIELVNPIALPEPVPVPTISRSDSVRRLGLWTLPDDVVLAVNVQMACMGHPLVGAADGSTMMLHTKKATL